MYDSYLLRAALSHKTTPLMTSPSLDYLSRSGFLVDVAVAAHKWIELRVDLLHVVVARLLRSPIAHCILLLLVVLVLST